MSLIRKHGAVLQAWACLDLVIFFFRAKRSQPLIDGEAIEHLRSFCAYPFGIISLDM